MNKFEYEQGKGKTVIVKMNGKRIGMIESAVGGFRYWPKGVTKESMAGPIFSSIRQVMFDIETP